MQEKVVVFDNNSILRELCGVCNKNVLFLEKETSTKILHKGNVFKLKGKVENISLTKYVLSSVYESLKTNDLVDKAFIYSLINSYKNSQGLNIYKTKNDINSIITINNRKIIAKTFNQKKYFSLLKERRVIFGEGVAGTGKTYLATCFGVSLLLKGKVDKLVLSRPAIEAGEKLGFLPGDMQEKINPYLKPIFDVLYEFFDSTEIEKKIAEGVIEIAPLAFMRGRTMKNSFILLDEAQNTTISQMKMFLTRLGKNSIMIVNGDLSQIDLAEKEKSGLQDAITKLKKIDEVGCVKFDSSDVLRDELVSKIVNAYEK